MLLKENKGKLSKNWFHKTFGNLKSIFFGGYQKLPKYLSFKSFSCATCNLRNYKPDRFYTHFYYEWENTHLQNMKERLRNFNSNSTMASKDLMKEENSCEGSFLKFANKQITPMKIKQRDGILKEKKRMVRRENESCSTQNINAGQNVLPQKMKELEIMDAGNLEQMWDLEEALHYYSRLKSPVYLGIVDNFFMDIYSEFSTSSPASVNINNSKRRNESFRT